MPEQAAQPTRPPAATKVAWAAAVVNLADSAEATVFKADTNDDINITATQGGLLQAALVLTNSDAPATDVSISTFRQSYQNTAGPSQNGLLQMRLPASAYQLELWREGTRTKRTNSETLRPK